MSKRSLKYRKPSLITGFHLNKRSIVLEEEGSNTLKGRRSSAEHLESLSQLYSNPTRNASMKAIDRLMAAKRKEKKHIKQILLQVGRSDSGAGSYN